MLTYNKQREVLLEELAFYRREAMDILRTRGNRPRDSWHYEVALAMYHAKNALTRLWLRRL